MTLLNRRILLWVSDLVILSGMGAALWYAWTPVALPAGSGLSKAASRPTSRSAAAAAAIPSAEHYAIIYRRPLRGPLNDAPAAAPGAVKSQPQPQTMAGTRLIGTVVESGGGFAIVVTAQNEEKLLAVGKSINNAQLKSVTPTTATFECGGKQVTLSTPPRPGPYEKGIK